MCCVAVAMSACSAGTTPRSLGGSPSPTSASPSPSNSPPPLPPLPAGYIRLSDRSSFVSLGVPHTWFHARLDSSDPTLTKLESGTGHTASRWKSFAKAATSGGVFAASDPLSADTVLLIEKDLGVDITDLDKFDGQFRSGLSQAGKIRGSSHITLDGKRGLRYLVDYSDSASGAIVHEVVDVFVINGTLVDFTFSGAAASITAVTATIHFHSG